MDPDFEPTEPHPFVLRTEQESGQRLAPEDYALHGDTLGSLFIQRTDTCVDAGHLQAFTFTSIDTGDTGAVSCEYNGFNELTDLWIDTPRQRTHSQMQWDEDGNLSAIHQEVWTQTVNATDSAISHTMLVIEYQYSQHSAYGNWYADMAEQIGGPIAAAFHAGQMGRSPWTLPERITYVRSVILDNMIGEQHSSICQPAYTYDRNGRVVSERLVLPDITHMYIYTYNN